MTIGLIVGISAAIVSIIAIALNIRNRRALKRWKDEWIPKKES